MRMKDLKPLIEKNRSKTSTSLPKIDVQNRDDLEHFHLIMQFCVIKYVCYHERIGNTGGFYKNPLGFELPPDFFERQVKIRFQGAADASAREFDYI